MKHIIMARKLAGNSKDTANQIIISVTRNWIKNKNLFRAVNGDELVLTF